MFSNMFLIEHNKTMRQTIVWVETGILAVLIAGLELLLFVALKIAPTGETGAALGQVKSMVVWPGALIQILSLASAGGMGALMVIILTGALVTQEYHWRTLHLWLGRGVPRLTYALARFASLLLPMLLLVLASLLAGGLVSLAISLGVDGSLHLNALNAGQLFLGILRTVYTLLPYAALTMLLGVATRSTVVAIGGGLAFSLLFESIIAQVLVLLGGPVAAATKFLPMAMAMVMTQANRSISTVAVAAQKSQLPTLDFTSAAIGIALYTVVFLGLACWIMKKQDLSA